MITLKQKENVFQNLEPLTEKVCVYIPSTYDVNKKIDNSYYVKEVMKMFSILFGGVTANNSVGGWITEDNELVIENVTIVYSYCSMINDDILENVSAIATWLKEEMRQEAISIELNDKLYFV